MGGAFSYQKSQRLICECVWRRQRRRKQEKQNKTELFRAKWNAASPDITSQNKIELIPGFKITLINFLDFFYILFLT